MATRAATVQAFNRLVRRSELKNVQDDMSKILMGIAKNTLQFFKLEQNNGFIEMPEPEEVKQFMVESLPPSTELFCDKFFKMPAMPYLLLKEIADLYGCGNVDGPLIQSMCLDTAESDSNKIKAIFWLTWLSCDSATFTRSFVATFKVSTDAAASLAQESPHESQNPNQHPQQPQQPNHPQPQQPQQPQPAGFSLAVSGLQARPSSGQYGNIHVYQVGNEVHASIPGGNVPSGLQPFHGIVRRRTNDDEVADIRKARNIQGAFSRENKFTGDFKQSIQVTLQLYEHYGRQNSLRTDQMAHLFMSYLDGPARLFFLRNVQLGDTYEKIKAMMLKEYNSDARRLQVEGHLTQLRLRKLMTEKNISDVSKGLSALVNKIEELSPQCHIDFQTDHHKIRYLCDAVAEFSEWSLGPMENINSQQYTFNCFVTALHESIQAKAKVKMLSNEVTGYVTHPEEPAHTHIGQYARNPRHARREHQAVHKTNGRTPRSFAEARQMVLCFKCFDKWEPKHLCKPGAIRTSVCDRLKGGESAVHLVSLLFAALERDGNGKPNETNHVAQDVLEEFESYQTGQEKDVGHEYDESDEAIATQHISSAINPAMDGDADDEYFLQGDEESLSRVAQN